MEIEAQVMRKAAVYHRSYVTVGIGFPLWETLEDVLHDAFEGIYDDALYDLVVPLLCGYAEEPATDRAQFIIIPNRRDGGRGGVHRWPRGRWVSR